MQRQLVKRKPENRAHRVKAVPVRPVCPIDQNACESVPVESVNTIQRDKPNVDTCGGVDGEVSVRAMCTIRAYPRALRLKGQAMSRAFWIQCRIGIPSRSEERRVG